MTPSFQRKVIYAALIAALLVPLSLISRPATVAVGGAPGSTGGKLAQLREEHKLGQAQLGQIDPTSSAVRYVSLGLHGLAACILWNKADEYQKNEDWISYQTVLKQLTVLQPYYVKVWTHQAWNVSYNIAAQWDDFRDKYFWVISGFKLLARGREFNELEPQFPYDLGWTVGHKIGQADERNEFRMLFSRDDEFHRLPWAAWANERDNWLFGKRYLEFAQDLVDRRGAVLRSTGSEVFNQQPAISQGEYAVAIEREGIFGEKARRAWQQASVEWRKFGEREFPSGAGFPIRYVDLPVLEERLTAATERFAALVPGVRVRLQAERRAQLSDPERKALDAPLDTRTPTELRVAAEAERKIFVGDLDVAEAADTENRDEARKLAREVVALRERVTATKGSRKIFNYDYWVARCAMEQTDEALSARELFHRALAEADEKPWAARKTFEDAFQRWRVVLDKYPQMVDDQTAYGIYQHILAYQRVLRQLDEPFDKTKFVLRDLLEKNEGM